MSGSISRHPNGRGTANTVQAVLAVLVAMASLVPVPAFSLRILAVTLAAVAIAKLAASWRVRQDDDGALTDHPEPATDASASPLQAGARDPLDHLIRRAVESASQMICITDIDGVVLYANAAYLELIRRGENEVRTRQSDFTAQGLIGHSIAVLYEDPRPMLAAIKSSVRASTRSRLFDTDLDIIATPIHDESGHRLGTMRELSDVTRQVETESDIMSIVEAATRGDFTARAHCRSTDGFYLRLSEGINRILELSDAALNELSHVLSALADGDLNVRMQGQYQGNLAKLSDDANRTVDELVEIVQHIRASTDSIHHAAHEIATGNSDLSARTERQAAALEQTATSMEELTATVKQNADSARHANSLAIGASEVAMQGGEKVAQVITTMTAITDSSKRIADIIGVIDAIAFQTNILALNAAVEAARAGEQGRGFAVVATEVRSLAQRSATAAKDIKSLINTSVERIQSGSSLVGEAGKTMTDLVTAVRRVTDIMAQITAASAEQSAGIEQVGQAIGHMDDATQQNAALVEQAAANASSLETHAESLALAVARFRLAESPTARYTSEFRPAERARALAA